MSKLCGEWRQRLGLPDAWVVSNRVDGLPRSMTHARARGSNDLIGAHVITAPPATLRALVSHPLTDKGLAAFLADWKKTGQTIG